MEGGWDRGEEGCLVMSLSGKGGEGSGKERGWLEQKRGGTHCSFRHTFSRGKNISGKQAKKGERSGCGIHSSGGVCIATQREALPPLQSHERKRRRKTVRAKKEGEGIGYIAMLHCEKKRDGEPL